MVTQKLENAMEGLVVLIADSNPYTRRLTRMMLTNLGIKSTYEAGANLGGWDRSTLPERPECCRTVASVTK